jgi:hypothetical protein
MKNNQILKLIEDIRSELFQIRFYRLWRNYPGDEMRLQFVFENGADTIFIQFKDGLCAVRVHKNEVAVAVEVISQTHLTFEEIADILELIYTHKAKY